MATTMALLALRRHAEDQTFQRTLLTITYGGTLCCWERLRGGGDKGNRRSNGLKGFREHLIPGLIPGLQNQPTSTPAWPETRSAFMSGFTLKIVIGQFIFDFSCIHSILAKKYL